MTTPIAESKGIPPSEYTRFLERHVAHHEAFVKRRRRERLLSRAMWASVAFLAAVAIWELLP